MNPGSDVRRNGASGQFPPRTDQSAAALLARVEVDTGHAVVPEVSANKYTVNVRFLEHAGHFQSSGRAVVTARSIPFRMALCAL